MELLVFTLLRRSKRLHYIYVYRWKLWTMTWADFVPGIREYGAVNSKGFEAYTYIDQ